MQSFPIRLLLFIISLFVFSIAIYAQKNQAKKESVQEEYQCIPCGSDCDNKTYADEGKCPHCNMQLVKRSTVNFGTVQPSEICDYIKQHPDVVLLDVRTKEEFEGKASPNFGTLKNAINIPIQDLEQRIAAISNFKNRKVIVYCSHSRRSPRASYILTQNGFTDVINMAGGMSEVNDNACKK